MPRRRGRRVVHIGGGCPQILTIAVAEQPRRPTVVPCPTPASTRASATGSARSSAGRGGGGCCSCAQPRVRSPPHCRIGHRGRATAGIGPCGRRRRRRRPRRGPHRARRRPRAPAVASRARPGRRGARSGGGRWPGAGGRGTGRRAAITDVRLVGAGLAAGGSAAAVPVRLGDAAVAALPVPGRRGDAVTSGQRVRRAELCSRRSPRRPRRVAEDPRCGASRDSEYAAGHLRHGLRRRRSPTRCGDPRD